MDTRFVHLRMHSEYSVTDSTVRLDSAIKKVKEQGVGALGLTDLNNIFGGLIFYTHARKAGVKALMGCDLVIQNETDRELFAAVVQARAVRYHAQMSVSDVGKATARLRAALDAQATEQQVTVTFDTNGGSQVDPQTIEKNSTVLRPDDPYQTPAGFSLLPLRPP